MNPIPSGKSLDSLIEQYNRELMRAYERSALPQKAAAAAAPPAPEPAGDAVVAFPAAQPDRAVAAQPMAAPPADSAAQIEAAREISLAEMARSASLPPTPPLTAPSDAAESPTGPDENSSPSPSDAPPTGTDTVPPSGSPTGGGNPMNPAGTPESDTGFLQVQVYTARGATPIPDAYITISRDNGQGDELYTLTFSDQNGFSPLLPVPTVNRSLSQQPGSPTPFSTYDIRVDAPGYFTVRDLRVPVYGGVTSVQPAAMIPLPENFQGDPTRSFVVGGPNEL